MWNTLDTLIVSTIGVSRNHVARYVYFTTVRDYMLDMNLSQNQTNIIAYEFWNSGSSSLPEGQEIKDMIIQNVGLDKTSLSSDEIDLFIKKLGGEIAFDNQTPYEPPVEVSEPPTGFLDDFNRPNGALGSDWENLFFSPMIITNNVVSELSPSGNSDHLMSVTTSSFDFSDNQVAQVVVNLMGANNKNMPGVAVRLTNNNGYIYIGEVDDSSGYNGVWKMAGSTWTKKVASGSPFADGDTIKLEVRGQNPVEINAYINGVLDCAATDTDTNRALTGQPGMTLTHLNGTDFIATLDNFEAYNLE